jgi:HPt (histidine-containing phosphotransfer) domain-containing protein
MKGDRERCLSAGMDGYISKPMRGTELDEALQSAMRWKDRSDRPGKNDSTLEPIVEMGDRSDIVNESELLAAVAGDWQLVRELAETFQTEAPALLAQLRAALSQKDENWIVRTSHTLKGAIANLAAPRALSLACRMESLARQNNHDGVEKLLNPLEFALRQLQNALVQLCSSHCR